MEKTYENKVKDIMIPIYDYPTVSGEATLKDVLRIIMNSYHFQGKPRTGRSCVFVVENFELVGIFGIPELLAAIEPQYIKGSVKSVKGYTLWATTDIAFFWDGLLTERCQEIVCDNVKDFMKPIENYVDINDTLLKAAYSMVKNKADTVAVKDKKRLVGMIHSVDIFREIIRIVFQDDSTTISSKIINSAWDGNITFKQPPA
ncbi:CBS domain-containing protein [Desulfotomaculum arcticum]|uniref:CBS domain-containing protein n=1 Tax=Desulfotruncus arcticus DSM 17038 TaxID=1121424 RepID=A0A1I2QMI5_9FIRM|nr:CBS domain-containing protein [Desulfotruncus arcticus]SFG26886.1 CBS domain-containing protein [Desulfotomaculum arcticum] [Desulfotruncus arcticus DSM 17038]